ncbi:MAG: hypothetical protein PHE17_00070 [Thiothrix sp.]|uniref:hypothetical protein n=1 Tax=Thiothrix sp. TaxID=1032 RepID=UPI002622604A|nr:hypothetical protein [Thiothrix sp.]MDD5391386.1 hypothetical protein [Thiothrix sp.]
MKKETVLALLLGVSLTAFAFPVSAEDAAQPADPMAAYYYNAPANSWYAAKIKPKLKAQMRAKVPAAPPAEVAAPSYTMPTNTPVARSVEPMQALPFWADVPAKK